MEAASGQKLDWMFDQWLRRGASPKLAGDWTYDSGNKQVKIKLRQAQEGEPYRLPLEIGLKDSGGSVAVQKVELAGRDGEFALPAVTAPTEVVLDPNVWLLMAEPEFAKAAAAN
jgi:aminopeptidase N